MQPVQTINPGLFNPAGHSDEEILAGIRGVGGSRRWTFRYELLDDSNVKIGDLDNVEAGAVEQNWLADIKRTAKFTIKETQYINYLSDRVKPWTRLHLPPYGTDDWVEWPQGVFILSTPTRSVSAAGHVSREVEGYDLTQILLDDKVPTRYTVTAGTAYTTAVLALLPATGTYITPSAATVPVALEWDPGTSKLKIVNDLLAAVNYNSLSVDEHGIFVVSPYQSPAVRAPEYTYGVTEDSIMLPAVDQTLDLFSIPNQWVLVVSEPDKPVTVGTYTNNDPGSPTSTVRRGRTIVDFRTEQDAADQATLTAKAARLGFEASQIYEAIDFETGLNPLHSGNDIYKIVDPRLLIDATFVEQQWSMTFTAGAPMKHRARRVLSLAP